ncbi:WAP four-disulfide core domain protein 3-like [Melanotaenia boesemani]|uniref:WAP four-disulfide core domain protein 3-like n=1 Tax=Melanotaenia boesemani TaxID=1250792 RepID=UPI001C05E536|nr:WAP four-disulfide core domain protein 3-like [Melanotaenia boesemani]
METHWSTLGALILSFGVLVQPFHIHIGTHSKPGQCPRHLNSIPSRLGCECDEDCPDDHKCCEYFYGNICLPPVFIKAECPHFRNIGNCFHLCADDRHCLHGRKCCFNGCGYECMAPRIVKPGHCGLPNHHCERHCSDDTHCDGHEKEMPNRRSKIQNKTKGDDLYSGIEVNMERRWSTIGALILVSSIFLQSHAISPPREGECPRIFYGIIWQHCQEDSECPGNHKCCLFDRTFACAPPVIKVCPGTNGRVGLCAEFCSSDRDCSRGFKCCSNGCGHQCTRPVTVYM